MKKSKKGIFLILVILLVVLACILGFYIFPREFLMNFVLTIIGIIPTTISYAIFSKYNINENSSIENHDYYDAIRKTLDIENNIIPYLMDMEFNLMNMEDK